MLYAEQLHAERQLSLGADGGYGGGAGDGILNNCALSGNSAVLWGRGVWQHTE